MMFVSYVTIQVTILARPSELMDVLINSCQQGPRSSSLPFALIQRRKMATPTYVLRVHLDMSMSTVNFVLSFPNANDELIWLYMLFLLLFLLQWKPGCNTFIKINIKITSFANILFVFVLITNCKGQS